jgi:hypothetical protein
MTTKNLWLLSIILFTAYALILTFGSIKGFPSGFKEDTAMPYLSDKPVGEDGFYMLTIAWNIPIQKKITYNFGTPTSGVQPLSTFVFSLVAYAVQLFGGDKWIFVRLIIFFESVFLLVFSFLLYRITIVLFPEKRGDNFIKLICACFTLFNFTFFKLFTYGLETGVYINLFALVVLISLRVLAKDSIKLREWFSLSLLMGVTSLARIDFGIVSAFMLFILLLNGRITFRRFVFASFMIFIVVMPWLFYVKYITDSWIPSSGTAQSASISSADDLFTRVIISIIALLDQSVPFVYTGNKMLMGALCVLIWGLILFLNKRLKVRSVFTKSKQLQIILYWLYSIIPLVIIYTVFFTSIHFYLRYFAPLAVIFIPLLTIEFANLFSNKKLRLIKYLPVAVAFVSFFTYSYVFYHTGSTGWSKSISAGYVYNSHLESKRIGAFQSGVMGYFNSNVFNLDGKIDHNALKYVKENKIHEYIDTMNIDYLTDWPLYLNFIDSSYFAQNWRRISGTPQDSSLYYERIVK